MSVVSHPGYGDPASLTTPAIAVLIYVTRQRQRLQQSIPLSEILARAGVDEELARAGLAECVQEGWMSRSTYKREPMYSIVHHRGQCSRPVKCRH